MGWLSYYGSSGGSGMPLILIFILSLLGFTDAANAATSQIWYSKFGVNGSIHHDSWAAACQESIPPTYTFIGVIDYLPSQKFCNYSFVDGGTTFETTSGAAIKVIQCDQGSPSEWTQAAEDACPVSPPVTCEQGVRGEGVTSGKASTFCLFSCEFRMTSRTCDSTSCFNVGISTGNQCSPDTGTTSLTPEQSCMAQGNSYGTVNGVSVCVPKIASGAAPTETTTSTTTTTTPAPTPEQPNPTPVTEITYTTTSISGGTSSTSSGTGSPSVSQTQTDPTGATTTTESTADNFCAQNPNSSICKAQTQCQENPTGPTCKHFCEAYPNSYACQNAQDLIGNSADIPNDGALTEQTIDAPTYSAISMPSSNTCPSDMTITIAGSPVTVSFAWICAYASAFKTLVVAFAMFAAAMIVIQGVKADANPYQRGLF